MHCDDELDALELQSSRLIGLIQADVASGHPQRGGPADALIVVQGHLDSLTAARRRQDHAAALKAANGLTGVNRGLIDAVWTDAFPAVGDVAFTVSKLAIEAAKCLRQALGMAF